MVGRRRENQLAHRRIPSKQPHLVVDIVGGPVRARSLLQKLPELHGRRAPAIEPRLQRRTPPLSKIRRRPQLSAAVHAREGQMDLDNAHRAERGWGAGDRHGRERHGLQPGVTHTVVCRRYVPSQTSDVFPTGRRNLGAVRTPVYVPLRLPQGHHHTQNYHTYSYSFQRCTGAKKAFYVEKSRFPKFRRARMAARRAATRMRRTQHSLMLAKLQC